MKALLISALSAHLRFVDLPGEEPAFVLLHGLGASSSSDFPAVAHTPSLSSYRFILPDFFGFGYSDRPADFDYSIQAHAETVYEVLRSVGLSGVNLFGHSMGGTVAVALAAAHPELVRSIVLAEANLDPGHGQGSKMIAEQPENDYITEGHDQFIEGIRKSIKDEPGLAGYLGALALADPRAMYRSAVGLIRSVRPSPRELFLSMTIPRAFIVGERSLPYPSLDTLRSAGISVLTVAKAGHAMMDDNPEGFAAAFLEAFVPVLYG
jgi:pimeloyl-ACP methyl ester carboxylesterase